MATPPTSHLRLSRPPPKRYRVGEIAQHAGLTRQTLHNYTRWGLIEAVAWTDGGHRLYDESVFARLAQIIAMKPSHTIDQIRRLLGGAAASETKGEQSLG